MASSMALMVFVREALSSAYRALPSSRCVVALPAVTSSSWISCSCWAMPCPNTSMFLVWDSISLPKRSMTAFSFSIALPSVLLELPHQRSNLV